MERSAESEPKSQGTQHTVNVAVIGCGWGWHLPHLARYEHVKIVALVEPNSNPFCTLSSSPLLPPDKLAEKYSCPVFHSVAELLESDLGAMIDGAVVAASHSAHFTIGAALIREGLRRRDSGNRVLNLLLEKASNMNDLHATLHVNEARKLAWLSKEYTEGAFIIPQATVAKHLIATKKIGQVRHIVASMNGPLMWLFDDPRNDSWTKLKTNHGEQKSGYGWGQMAHILAWIYTVVGDEVAIPTRVYCDMGDAPVTGADVSIAAVVSCSDGTTFALSGTALLPGSQYTDPPVGKLISVHIFGDQGSLMYSGDDRIPASGRLEWRKTSHEDDDNQVRQEFPCSNGDWATVVGEEIMIQGHEAGGSPLPSKLNDVNVGLRTVQIIEALYRSASSGTSVKVD
ncbi:hypothetical protein THAOC_16938 [Thalassiosira oceanica]|uniref:Gfo/Idh/MocA-like oxidoreductase N-terminal domain-containing protein n=1 Tax=Thalassiosira oceanica TaxID=159749 RepID=K0SNB9_THAOC|nr:hypothetical protein THAOC_16938 [Thalassiosira oceanica]|eukprot:EJK62451.1 hypothetical protein THAOC_16938 [Thalassiosira oceanica]